MTQYEIDIMKHSGLNFGIALDSYRKQNELESKYFNPHLPESKDNKKYYYPKTAIGRCISNIKYKEKYQLESEEEMFRYFKLSYERYHLKSKLNSNPYVVVPFPSNSEQYNHVFSIAERISEYLDVPYLDLFSKNTDRKGKEIPDGQDYNLGDFSLKYCLPDENILLIDDVYDIGRTLNQLLGVLKSHGYQGNVDFISFARITGKGFGNKHEQENW